MWLWRPYTYVATLVRVENTVEWSQSTAATHHGWQGASRGLPPGLEAAVPCHRHSGLIVLPVEQESSLIVGPQAARASDESDRDTTFKFACPGPPGRLLLVGVYADASTIIKGTRAWCAGHVQPPLVAVSCRGCWSRRACASVLAGALRDSLPLAVSCGRLPGLSTCPPSY